ncbi:MAG: hypothetical protein JO227_13980 [Acetobacteraceae bacterium]|nr:hypothetical protein [Acetobacteraceae bacterium]
MLLDAASDTSRSAQSKAGLHYAPNGNFDSESTYLPAKAGFNLADVDSVQRVNALPIDVQALVWVGMCNGVDAEFVAKVSPYLDHPKVFGFYLMDDPDPRELRHGIRSSSYCSSENLRAESDWIHERMPKAKTFIALMNMATAKAPSYENSYNSANSHVDLFGVAPYPCRSELNGCDYDMINRFVAAAEWWGIMRSQIVPIYQTFGEGKWVTDSGTSYKVPTAAQVQRMIARWGELIANPAFDYAYSWGSQNSDKALGQSSELQAVFAWR